MIAESGFVITIGDHGAVVALHKNNEIKNKIFLKKLTDDIKLEIAKVFAEDKIAPVYILLDTNDQSYRKKTYPFIKKSDLLHLIKRDLAPEKTDLMPDEKPSEALHNYLILNEPKFDFKLNLKKQKPAEAKHWDCLFISATINDEIQHWLDFLSEINNRLVAIYMLPIEAFTLYRLLKKDIKQNSKTVAKKEDLCCIITQNKVGGSRQIVFSSEGILFTRSVDYDFEDPAFIEKYEQDIYSIFEYLKRPFADLTLKDLQIVNIFPQEILAKIKNTTNVDLNFINYTPFQAACNAGFNSLIPQNSHYCDLLISKAFFNSKKKILKFSTTKIALLEKLFIITRGSYYLNLIMLLLIAASCLLAIYSYNSLEEEKTIAEIENLNIAQSINKAKINLLDGEQILDAEGEVIDIDRILDVGKTYETFTALDMDISSIYGNLKFIREYGVKLSNFSYVLSNFNPLSPSKNTEYKIVIDGNIYNKSGNIEELLEEFDALTAEFRKNFSGKKIQSNEVPKNIDFTKKYYDFPVQFSVLSSNANDN